MLELRSFTNNIIYLRESGLKIVRLYDGGTQIAGVNNKHCIPASDHSEAIAASKMSRMSPPNWCSVHLSNNDTCSVHNCSLNIVMKYIYIYNRGDTLKHAWA